MSNSPNLQLPYLDPNQNQKTVTHNAALTVLDALVNCQVQSAALTAPPTSPGDGQCWIVGPGSTGAWAGKDLTIAAWQSGAWSFYPPTRGMLAFNDATAALLVWSGTAWMGLSSLLALLSVTALGVGTAPDTGNPLSATLNTALFNALATTYGGTGDVRLKLNKQALANTASFLFQDGFAGRAEIGLCGDDSFHFKVSADGSVFRDALVLSAANGAAQASYGLTTPSLNGGPLAGCRNRLVNGNFAVNQRALASGTALAAGAYGFDRWKAGSGGATLTYAAALPDTAVTIAAGTLVQVIEDASVEGGTYTLSWAGTATARVYQGSATGGYAASPLTVTGLAAGAATIVEFTGGTLGTVQMEPGATATPFERRLPQQELAICQRFYETGYIDLRTYCASSAQIIGMMQQFSTTKRANPTIVLSGIAYSNASSATADSVTQRAFRFYATGGTSNPIMEAYGNWSASAEL